MPTVKALLEMIENALIAQGFIIKHRKSVEINEDGKTNKYDLSVTLSIILPDKPYAWDVTTTMSKVLTREDIDAYKLTKGEE